MRIGWITYGHYNVKFKTRRVKSKEKGSTRVTLFTTKATRYTKKPELLYIDSKNVCYWQNICNPNECWMMLPITYAEAALT